MDGFAEGWERASITRSQLAYPKHWFRGRLYICLKPQGVGAASQLCVLIAGAARPAPLPPLKRRALTLCPALARSPLVTPCPCSVPCSS